MAIRCKIERIVARGWRGTQTAKFQAPGGYFLCDVWFDRGKPCFQIRSDANPISDAVSEIETAAVVAAAIRMAIAWAAEELSKAG